MTGFRSYLTVIGTGPCKGRHRSCSFCASSPHIPDARGKTSAPLSPDSSADGPASHGNVEWVVDRAEHKVPLSKFLRRKGVGNMEIRRASLPDPQGIKAGKVLVEALRITRSQFFVKAGQTVQLVQDNDETVMLSSDEWRERVLYEDDVLLVVDKPPGFTSLPSDNDNGRSVLSQVERWLRDRVATAALPLQASGARRLTARLLPLHRLDKDTSGVLLFCKQKWAVAGISEQFRSQRVSKKYLALLSGCLSAPPRSTAVSRAPHQELMWRDTLLMRKGKASVVRASDIKDHGISTSSPALKEAVTNVRVLKVFPMAEATLVEFAPKTGRTHQLRVQSQSRGHPLLGDPIYGPPYSAARRRSQAGGEAVAAYRLALHCSSMELQHPVPPSKGSRGLSFEAPLPADVRELLAALERIEEQA
eukprot:CAMPEP_0117689708 /NCGR_PEP_ID=MMETSP0804-20121206/24669_1 /TAXON_ID=1074897 /ORGANISM="Tetraselmis astigmatica, Strain CCMP880" /LENGTH=418 /DNA_ID=CAMNT_0005502569 /DNA_START=9 /DNA_END=1266 /DNA_ORIENTATION=-